MVQAIPVDMPIDDGRNDKATGMRKASYKMLKNKGMVPSRNKDVRNPRVHNRKKFEKATKKRKVTVQPHKTETKRYAGMINFSFSLFIIIT